ncbi:DUF397 domain-containing protein [Streptosporangium sp. NPDC051023]|uniref:DUF397 domain-containing protein n=1 Tax=Streptosporangium sp. NPDC051023 TaxID=3155410 RepID=UPI0034503B4D
MDLSNLPWRKSSFSSPNGGDCVEVAELAIASPRPEHKRDASHAVRDSKDPSGPVLYFTPIEWRVFIDGVKSSAFDSGLGQARGTARPERPGLTERSEQAGRFKPGRSGTAPHDQAGAEYAP